MKRYLFFTTIILGAVNVFSQPFKGGKGDGHAFAEQKNVFISSVRTGSNMDASFFPTLMVAERTLSVRSSSSQVEVLIFDPAGKSVLSKEIKGNDNISLAGLTTGIYFIELRNRESQMRGKLTIIE